MFTTNSTHGNVPCCFDLPWLTVLDVGPLVADLILIMDVEVVDEVVHLVQDIGSLV